MKTKTKIALLAILLFFSIVVVSLLFYMRTLYSKTTDPELCTRIISYEPIFAEHFPKEIVADGEYLFYQIIDYSVLILQESVSAESMKELLQDLNATAVCVISKEDAESWCIKNWPLMGGNPFYKYRNGFDFYVLDLGLGYKEMKCEDFNSWPVNYSRGIAVDQTNNIVLYWAVFSPSYYGEED